MPKHVVTAQVYDNLVKLYRQYPGNPHRVALEAGVSCGTAMTAWEKGWPTRRLQAVKTKLIEEGVVVEGLVVDQEAVVENELATVQREVQAYRKAMKARAATEMHEALQAVNEKIKGADVMAKKRLDELLAKANIGILESKVDRMKMVKDARRSAGALLSFIAETYRQSAQVEAKVFEHIDQLEPREAVAWVVARSKLTKEAIEAAQMAVALEDREYGRPDVIVAHTQLALPEALAEIDEAKALADLIREGDVNLLTAGDEPAITVEVDSTPIDGIQRRTSAA